MMYEVTDNRIKIGDYFFEMDTEHDIHIYAKGMKYIDKIQVGHFIDFDKFKNYCNEWIISQKNS